MLRLHTQMLLAKGNLSDIFVLVFYQAFARWNVYFEYNGAKVCQKKTFHCTFYVIQNVQ